jgi:predicted  nucleic acid-binding Zn-ribbon protein
MVICHRNFAIFHKNSITFSFVFKRNFVKHSKRKENMNKAIALLAIVTLLTSCKSANQKESAARENVTEVKQDLKNTLASNAAEWKTFKAEAQEKIIHNEQRIGTLNEKMNKPGNTFDGLYRTRIEKLESKNAELKSKLVKYDGNETEWKTFKSDFNRDMKEIGNNIQDLFR